MLSMLCQCACEPRKLAYAVRHLLLVEDSIMWSDVENVLFSYKVSHKPKIIVYQFANCLFALSISDVISDIFTLIGSHMIPNRI